MKFLRNRSKILMKRDGSPSQRESMFCLGISQEKFWLRKKKKRRSRRLKSPKQRPKRLKLLEMTSVEDAIDRGEEDTEVVPASTEASETSTYDKYKNAFSVEQFDIKY